MSGNLRKSRVAGILFAAFSLIALGWVSWSCFFAEVPARKPAGFDLESQILPYFGAYEADSGTLAVISGEPQSVVVKGGKLYVQFLDQSSGRRLYVDPLAIRSQPWGEHPADKVLRLGAHYGLPINRVLGFCLRNRHLRGMLFHRLPFEHQPDKKAVGVVAEIDVTGSFLVIADPVPGEWQPREAGYLTPSFFFVNHDPNDPRQAGILEAAGFDFDPARFGSDLVEQMWGMLEYCRGGGLRTVYWIADTLKELGVALDEETRLVGGFTVLNGQTYLSASDDFLKPTAARVYEMDGHGTLHELYRAPGRIILAVPNPVDPTRWLVSGEGYEQSDPRFQSLLVVDVQTSEWRVIQFPLFQLYASAARYSPDGTMLFLVRYGTIDEGGGLWVVDLTDPDYSAKKKLLSWDHIVDWFPVGPLTRRLPSDGAAKGTFPVLITAKEVEREFAMTINRAVLRLAGMDSEILDVEQLGQTAGWSPRIVHTEETGQGRSRFYIEVTHDLRAYMEGDPSAIYVVDVP